MKLTQVLKKLSGLAGGLWRVEAKTFDGSHSGPMEISSVDELKPRERLERVNGNVILSFPKRDKNGLPRGGTFWAKDVVSITWEGKERATIKGKNESLIMFRFLHPLIMHSTGKTPPTKPLEQIIEQQEILQPRLFD